MIYQLSARFPQIVRSVLTGMSASGALLVACSFSFSSPAQTAVTVAQVRTPMSGEDMQALETEQQDAADHAWHLAHMAHLAHLEVLQERAAQAQEHAAWLKQQQAAQAARAAAARAAAARHPVPHRTQVPVKTAGRPATPVAQPKAATPAAHYTGSSAMQECIIRAESGGNSQIWNASGHYGLYQFSEQTWAAHGGNPADFGHASVAEQNAVFAQTVADDGYSDWTPYDGC